MIHGCIDLCFNKHFSFNKHFIELFLWWFELPVFDNSNLLYLLTSIGDDRQHNTTSFLNHRSVLRPDEIHRYIAMVVQMGLQIYSRTCYPMHIPALLWLFKDVYNTPGSDSSFVTIAIQQYLKVCKMVYYLLSITFWNIFLIGRSRSWIVFTLIIDKIK